MSATAEGATMRDEHEPAEPGRDHPTDRHLGHVDRSAGQVDRPAGPGDAHAEPARSHQVHESDVRLALERLSLGDRALTVHRATAFLTALGVTVTHDGPPAPDADARDEAPAGAVSADRASADVPTPGDAPVPSAVGTALPTPRDLPVPSTVGSAVPATSAVPAARVTAVVATPAPDAEDDPTDGDIANLLEVLAHLHDRGTTTADDLRGRPRTLQPRPTAVATV
ncbi:hypothetical protein [Cellulomonas biazotea]|uniref:hypothetical protein n=1 Tax=Cellulomonas biazotea TaxID=1709 RepID=UPI00103191ED|nr:hypothetical protein [Cellulomonas biazotea]